MFETIRRTGRQPAPARRPLRTDSARSMGATVPTLAAVGIIATTVAIMPVGALAAPATTVAIMPVGALAAPDDDVAIMPVGALAAPDDERDDRLLDACPIAGDHEYQDSWGWARSGGRSHQGIDVGAERGTELYAVRDGIVDFKQSNLGGNSVWLATDDGDRFFYAHLDGFAGDDRTVAAGELIGYVGSTGNAGGPHLHFETHPGGSVENPYQHVVDACAQPGPDGLDAFLDRVRFQQLADAGRIAGHAVAAPGPATALPV